MPLRIWGIGASQIDTACLPGSEFCWLLTYLDRKVDMESRVSLRLKTR